MEKKKLTKDQLKKRIEKARNEKLKAFKENKVIQKNV